MGMSELFSVWNLIRLSGLLAYLLLTISVLGGMYSSFPFLKKRKGDLQALHQTGGWIGFLAVLFHTVLIWQDQYVDYTILEILIPFTDNEYPFASGIGTLAFFLFFFVIFSSDFLLKKLGKIRWKLIHFSVFPAWLLMNLHGILIGSDSSQPWVKIMYFASISLVCILLLVRLTSIGTRQPNVKMNKRESSI